MCLKKNYTRFVFDVSVHRFSNSSKQEIECEPWVRKMMDLTAMIWM